MNLLRRMDGLKKFLETSSATPDRSPRMMREFYDFSALYNKLDLWRKKGSKTFLLSKDLIDAFSMTTVPLDITPGEFNYPYDSFILGGEKPLFTTTDVEGRLITVDNILFMKSEIIEGIGFKDLNGKACSTIEWDISVSGIAPRSDIYALDQLWVNLRNDQTMKTGGDVTVSKIRNEVAENDIQKLTNIFFNTIMYINEPGRNKAHTEEPGKSKFKFGGKKKVTQEYIKLKPPKDYVSIARGTGKTLDSRFTVRGHWTKQAYGKGYSLRKRIWIKPYWKGPELSEIVSKKYRIG